MPGVEDLKNVVSDGLIRLYSGIARAMWEWTFPEQFRDALIMSRHTIPEVFLQRNGECCVFKYGDQLHILPYVADQAVNMYGYMDRWRPMPYGTDEYTKKGGAFTEISELELNPDNSVIIRNELAGKGDVSFITKMCVALTENILDASQLQMIASNPIIFNTTPDNLLTAKNVYLAMAEHRPVVFLNSLTEGNQPSIEPLGTGIIDPSLFEIFDRFECNLLSYLGFPCIPVTKRAQQTVSEIQSQSHVIDTRRAERLKCREQACERIKEVFGVDVSVGCIVDRMKEEQQQQQRMQQNGGEKDGE